MITFLLTQTKKYSMEELYNQIGRSRQQYYQQIKRNNDNETISSSLKEKIIDWRKKHSSMGSRTMYYSLKSNGIEIPFGVNKFEKFLSFNNLTMKRAKKYGPKTSDGKGKRDYPNLTNDLIINDINQLIVGDITYFWVEGKWHYIFTMKDVYSQRILSLRASKQMKAEVARTCLYDCEQIRGKDNLVNTIHHTDNGSQYESKIYLTEADRLKLRISRAEKCQENGSAEQLNYIIKNMYLSKWNIRSFKQLEKACVDLKYINNYERSIKQLNYLTPCNFESEIKSIPLEKRIQKQLYDFKK